MVAAEVIVAAVAAPLYVGSLVAVIVLEERYEKKKILRYLQALQLLELVEEKIKKNEGERSMLSTSRKAQQDSAESDEERNDVSRLLVEFKELKLIRRTILLRTIALVNVMRSLGIENDEFQRLQEIDSMMQEHERARKENYLLSMSPVRKKWNTRYTAKLLANPFVLICRKSKKSPAGSFSEYTALLQVRDEVLKKIEQIVLRHRLASKKPIIFIPANSVDNVGIELLRKKVEECFPNHA